jgi:hypothetical protein
VDIRALQGYLIGCHIFVNLFRCGSPSLTTTLNNKCIQVYDNYIFVAFVEDNKCLQLSNSDLVSINKNLEVIRVVLCVHLI